MTFLDDFRESYTLNWQTEKDSYEYDVCPPDEAISGNICKMLMWIPIISHIFATVMLVKFIKNYKLADASRNDILWISRCLIALTVPPLLIPIDLVGTLVKFCADAKKPAIDKKAATSAT